MSIPTDDIDKIDQPNDANDDAEIPHANMEVHAENGLEARHFAAEDHVAEL